MCEPLVIICLDRSRSVREKLKAIRIGSLSIDCVAVIGNPPHAMGYRRKGAKGLVSGKFNSIGISFSLLVKSTASAANSQKYILIIGKSFRFG